MMGLVNCRGSASSTRRREESFPHFLVQTKLLVISKLFLNIDCTFIPLGG